MPTTLDRDKVRRHLENFNLRALFIDELGWDHGGGNMEVPVDNLSFALKSVAQKRGMVAYRYIAESEEKFPDYPTRRKIERFVARTVREHLIVYATHERDAQYWQWVKREPGRPDRNRLHIYSRNQPGEALIQKLEHIAFTLEEEEDLTIVDVSGRVRAAFDTEKVTKKFYERFREEHRTFLGLIDGFETSDDDREWYASLMLNRMMFIYFIQKRGFLDDDPDYLRNRLNRMRTSRGKNRFQTFYRFFLLRLFHEGFNQPTTVRDPELTELLGKVPYLNGGLFDLHELERDNKNIDIPDEAFEGIFKFFDAYQWHLDDRPLRNDREINPDVLGYIFERYINQKQMGAYYTKEDITGYICRNTIIPFLFDQAKKECPIAFDPDGGVWRLLTYDPDRYFYESACHGITHDINENRDLAETHELPDDIAAGLDDVSKRAGWNNAAPGDYALPTETWREHIARRERYNEVRAKIVAGEIVSINDLITYNLDIEKFTQDVIAGSEGPELVRAFWKGISKVSILDPACGSGAFLFAALNILEPVYIACLETMRGFLDDLEHSRREHNPEALGDFRKLLERVGTHANERYFTLKSIIIGNLYGVDIMEEAIEICKLRLFLKLVAQLENYDQIEPLPDIDFNTRVGNTLIGFTSLEEVKRTLSADMINQLSLPKIEKRADAAGRSFNNFRKMQTDGDIDASAFTNAKSELRRQLDGLRMELNHYLAGEYDISTDDEATYTQWHSSYQPFHWFVEFHSIMCKGGFDVIIGNPPYVEYSKVKSVYQVKHFRTEKCGNIYAFCMEQSLKLLHKGARFSFIVPLSFQATARMNMLQQLFADEKRDVFLSSFDVYPSKLFEGAKQRLCLLVLSNRVSKPVWWTTSYNRWKPEERKFLFSNLRYKESYLDGDRHLIPKIGDGIAKQILNKLNRFGPAVYKEHPIDPSFYVHRIPYNYVKAFDFIPYFWNEVDGKKKSEDYKPYQVESSESYGPLLAALNSNLFFWWWYSLFEGYHCGRHEIFSFPIGINKMAADVRKNLTEQAKRLMDDYNLRSSRKAARYRKTGKVVYDEFYPRKSKEIIDQIDRELAHHYELSDEETDFIINHDIKYRLGL